MEKLLLPAIHLTALLAFILYKAKGPFFAYIKDRYTEISEGLNKSKVQAEWAEARRKNVEAKISMLESERTKIFSEWKAREQEQLKSITDSSQKLLVQMRLETEQNKKALEQQVKAQLLKKFAEQIVESAETKVKAGLNQESHKNINQQFTQGVSA